MKELKSSTVTIVLIVVTAVIISALIAGTIVYLWQQNKYLENQANQTPTATATAKTTTPVTSRDLTVEGDSPTDVTENFIVYTLGTVPGAEIDYNKAKTLASQNLLTQWTDDSFVPQFYGIQEGPDTYEMTTQTLNGDTAVVKVEVRWGDMGLAWAFGLVKENGLWKIDSLRDDAQ